MSNPHRWPYSINLGTPATVSVHPHSEGVQIINPDDDTTEVAWSLVPELVRVLEMLAREKIRADLDRNVAGGYAEVMGSQ